MDDALFVGGIEGVCELNAHFDGACDRQWPSGEQFVERLAKEKFHRDKGAAVVLFNRVDGANSGMVQSGGRASFPEKAFERLAVALVFFGNEFERNAPPKLGVFGFIDDAHSARAEFSENPIVGNGFVNHVWVARGMLNGRGNSVNAK
jgi:hypothetical protein